MLMNVFQMMTDRNGLIRPNFMRSRLVCCMIKARGSRLWHNWNQSDHSDVPVSRGKGALGLRDFLKEGRLCVSSHPLARLGEKEEKTKRSQSVVLRVIHRAWEIGGTPLLLF